MAASMFLMRLVRLIHTPQADFGFNQTSSGIRIVVDQLARMRGLLERFGIMIRGKRKQEQIVVGKGIVWDPGVTLPATPVPQNHIALQ